MADKSKIGPKKPTLFRPGTPEFLKWQANQDQVEEPWREQLKKLSNEELIEVAVAGAHRVTALLSTVDHLSAKAVEHRKARAKGGETKNPDKKQAKKAIYQLWRLARTKRRFDAGAFALRVTDQRRFGKVIKFDTVMKWCRTWAAEDGSNAPLDAKAQGTRLGQNSPEIYQLLGYFGSKTEK